MASESQPNHKPPTLRRRRLVVGANVLVQIVAALALVVMVGLTRAVLGEVGSGNLILPPVVLGIGTLVYELVLGIVLAVLGRLSVMGQVADINYVLTYITLPTLMYNVILILPIFRVMGLIFKASRPSRVSL